MSLNKLFYYEHMNEYTRADRTRRIVVVPTVKVRKCVDKNFSGGTTEEKLRLIAMAIGIRFKYDRKPPLTTMALLMTLFQSKFDLALSIVAIDENASSIMQPGSYAINLGFLKMICKTV